MNPATAPSALLIGDQELDRVEILLRRFGIDFERIRESRPTLQLPTPRRLLVVSGPCVPRLPTLLPKAEGEGDPLRVCIHSQDFLPLRDRLRDLGFHYLVQTALDETSLRVFIEQLLHPGESQRRGPRLPLGGSIEYRAASSSGAAKLVDLSAEGCRIAGVRGLRIDEAATVLLPAALGGGVPLVLHGHVMRLTGAGEEGQAGASAVIRFGVLDASARDQLDRLVQGRLPGTKVTPLAAPAAGGAAAPPASATAPKTHPKIAPKHAPKASPSQAESAARDRRREVRHPYEGRVEVLELPGGADGALGRDLSLAGVRIAGGQPLRLGAKLTLALYGGRGGEPVVVEAEVVRTDHAEAALTFGKLTDAQQDRIATLIAQQPALASLGKTGQPVRVIPTQILRRRG